MSALNPVLLNTEFWLLWSVRQLLRGIAIGIGITSAMLAMVLLWSAAVLAQMLETLPDRTRVAALPRNARQLATSTRGYKENLS
jgi:hypothetical protein